MSVLKLVVIVMLVALMLQCGLQVNRATIAGVFKKGALLSRAFLANFILVPAFALLLVRAFHLSDFIAAGILLMAIAPGVPFLPRAGGTKAAGSLAFALVLCFLMPALSIVTAPLTARLIFPPQAGLHIPVSSLIVTLAVFQLLPLFLGIIVSERSPQLASKLIRPLAAIVAIIIIVVVVLAAPQIGRAIATVYGSYGIITALLIVLFSLGIGWLFGGRTRPYRNTLAVATTLRNPGLALVVATTDLPGTPAVAMVVSYFVIQLIVATLFGRLVAKSTEPPAEPAAAPV